MKKGKTAQPRADIKEVGGYESVLTDNKDCDNDPGCGKPDASGGWRHEYRHQRVVAAVAHIEHDPPSGVTAGEIAELRARAALRFLLGRG